MIKKKMLEAEVCTAMNMGMKVAFYLGHLVRRQIYKFHKVSTLYYLLQEPPASLKTLSPLETVSATSELSKPCINVYCPMN